MARICLAESSRTAGRQRASRSRSVCLSIAPIRATPRAVSCTSDSRRALFIAYLLQFPLGHRVIKDGHVQRKQRRSNLLQRHQLTCVNRGAIVLLETKQEKPSISKIAA